MTIAIGILLVVGILLMLAARHVADRDSPERAISIRDLSTMTTQRPAKAVLVLMSLGMLLYFVAELMSTYF